MASITRRGEGYTVRWRDPDGTARRRQAPDRRTAERLQREIERAHALGRRWEPDTGGVALSALVAAYLDDRRRVWKVSTHAVREVSLSIFAAWAETTIRRRHLGLDVLSRSLLARYWSHLVDDRRVSPGTANERVRHAEQVWAWAYDHEEYGEATPRPRRLDLPSVVREDPRAPSWAQMDAAIGECTRERWRRLMVLLRCTGLRPGQVRRLRWDDVDLAAARLRIRGELGKTPHERRGRTIPMASVLVEELAGWGIREGLLVEDWNINNGTSRAIWSRTDAPAEVYRQPLHCFRKGWKSQLRRAGADPDALDYLQGHKIQGMRGVYTDPASLPLEETVAMVPALGCVPTVSRLRREKT